MSNWTAAEIQEMLGRRAVVEFASLSGKLLTIATFKLKAPPLRTQF